MRRAIMDQAAHFAAAFAVVALAGGGGLIGGALAGFICGMVREVAEAGNPVTLAKVLAAPRINDAPLDLAFWTMGGAAAALVF